MGQQRGTVFGDDTPERWPGSSDLSRRYIDRADGVPTHVITQATGGSLFPLAIVPHIGVRDPLTGERLLLCSDGLRDMLDDKVNFMHASRYGLCQLEPECHS
jgi:serine/threonine protein phosphatase PrpC